MYEGYAEEIDLRPAQKPYRDSAHMVLWEIEVTCAHGSCELKRPIYARYHEEDTAALVIDELLNADPILDCAVHALKLRKEKIHAKPLKF